MVRPENSEPVETMDRPGPAGGMLDSALSSERFSLIELQQATRNRGMPLEALRYDVTPAGMHYLLIHFDVPHTQASHFFVEMTGNVDRPASLSMERIRSLPSRTLVVTMECAGNGRSRMERRAETQPWLLEAIGTAEWTGTPLASVVEEAGVRPDSVELVFTGTDRGIQGGVEQSYQRSLALDDALRPEVLLAYEMNGRALEPQHGAPLRLVVPGWYGMTSVKWLRRIEAVTRTFEGFQQADAYRIQRSEDDPGERVTRMKVRALMVPPGIPDFPARQRFVEPGPVELFGRAWSGTASVVSVEVGVDGRFEHARLGPPVGPYAWRSWSYTWLATRGEHTLSCRATDESGDSQPLGPVWNVQGMANNCVQTVPVTVRPGSK